MCASVSSIVRQYIVDNNISGIYDLFLSGVDIHAPDTYGLDQLSFAIDYYDIHRIDISVIRLLLELGANAIGSKLAAPIARTANMHIITLLIDFGANLEDVHVCNLLTWQCAYQAVATILAYGGNINSQNSYGGTILSVTCAHQFDYHNLAFIIDHRADLNAVNREGDTALIRSCLNGQYKTAILLVIRNAEVNIANDNGETALFVLLDYDVVRRFNKPSMTEKRVLWKMLVDRGATYSANKCGRLPTYASELNLEPTAEEIETVCQSVNH